MLGGAHLHVSQGIAAILVDRTREKYCNHAILREGSVQDQRIGIA